MEPRDHPVDSGQVVYGAALEVKARLDAGEYQIPMLPEVALELTRLAGKADADVPAVEKVVARDPAVAARVVSRANSAAAARRGVNVTSLRVAITRLGLAEVRDVAFDIVARTRLFKVPAYEERMREVLEASRIAGRLAQEVCRQLGLEPDLAFLCGLLHDVGEAVILSICGESERWRRTLTPAARAQLVLGFHEQVGLRSCQRWKLPEVLCDAVAHHHHPERSTHPAQMARVVAVTDRLLEHAGIGVPARPTTPMGEPLFYSLNLRREQVALLLSGAERLAREPAAG